MKRILLLTTVLFAFSLGADELAVGAKAPAFELTNAVNGDVVRFAPGDGKLSVVVFTCNQCPYAKAFEDRIVALGNEYEKKGVVFYAIDPNDDAANPIESAGETWPAPSAPASRPTSSSSTRAAWSATAATSTTRRNRKSGSTPE